MDDKDTRPPLLERVELAKRLIEVSRDVEAVKVLESVVGASPDIAEFRLLMAQALTGCGRGDEAEPHLRKAMEDHSTASMASGMLGYWYQARGRFAEAKNCFEHSLEINPHQSLSYYGWVQANRVTHDHRPLIEQALALTMDSSTPPEDAMYLHYVLGKGLADLGDFEGSMRHYDEANKSAFEQLLGGVSFNRARYAESVDGTIATFQKEFFQRNRAIGSGNRIPIFVVGMMRSGTTLVEQILSSHTEVGAAGEVDFWLDEGPLLFDSAKRSVNLRAIGNAAKSYVGLLESISPGTLHVTDKMPQNFQMLGLIHLAFPKAPIIHIRRNPVDTCISIYTTAYQKSPAFAHDRDSIVFAYRQYQRLVAHWRKVLPKERFLDIDYEDLTGNPEPVIRRMVGFCGLSWESGCLQPQLNDRLVTTPSLWQVRQPMYRSAVERWRVYEPWLGPFRQLVGT